MAEGLLLGLGVYAGLETGVRPAAPVDGTRPEAIAGGEVCPKTVLGGHRGRSEHRKCATEAKNTPRISVQIALGA